MSYKITKEAFKEALREELREIPDLSSFIWTKYLRKGIDSFFLSRDTVNPSDVWDDDGFKADPSAAVYSRRCFSYPYLSVRTELPELTLDGQSLWFGFENDAGLGTGAAMFRYYQTGGAKRFVALFGGAWYVAVYDLTDALPADAETAKHIYTIKVNRMNVEFYIDYARRLTVINDSAAFPAVTYPPYAIARPYMPIPTHMHTIIELSTPEGELTFPLTPEWFRVEDGEPIPPRVDALRLADSTAPLRGQTVPSGTIRSHPIPIFGYEGKTLYFRADTNSASDGLVIETLSEAGNWRTYDAVTYTANDDWFYSIAGELKIIRLAYTPSSYPATVNEAEVVLR